MNNVPLSEKRTRVCCFWADVLAKREERPYKKVCMNREISEMLFPDSCRLFLYSAGTDYWEGSLWIVGDSVLQQVGHEGNVVFGYACLYEVRRVFLEGGAECLEIGV